MRMGSTGGERRHLLQVQVALGEGDLDVGPGEVVVDTGVECIDDRAAQSDSIRPSGEILVMQALSGG